MGMNAEIIAIGPYSAAVNTCLEYPPEDYDEEGVPEGTPVITYVLGCVTSEQSRALATALGMFPCRFQDHAFDGAALLRLKDSGALDALVEENPGWSGLKQQLFDLVQLAKHGFTFFYRPNY